MNDIFFDLRARHQKTPQSDGTALLDAAALSRTNTGTRYLHSKTNHRLAAKTQVVFHAGPKEAGLLDA
ncbi:MAG: hypothetical protein Q8P02_01960, partial [Candidatus Micrarchaeota archaeon]|nr:hypothetical protein [Candidatus Micrarchaeota archaeon]